MLAQALECIVFRAAENSHVCAGITCQESCEANGSRSQQRTMGWQVTQYLPRKQFGQKMKLALVATVQRGEAAHNLSQPVFVAGTMPLWLKTSYYRALSCSIPELRTIFHMAFLFIKKLQFIIIL